MSTQPPPPDNRLEYDPVFLHARREAIFIFCVWLTAFVWAVPFCYFNGYHYDEATFTTVWGIPTWLFWGIGVPWVAADVITIVFCFRIFRDDDLGVAQEGADIEQEIRELYGDQEEAGS